MIKVENDKVWGFEHAIRGMRNPMNSWDKSDSCWTLKEDESPINPNDEPFFEVGKNDLGLMKRLYKAGTEHRKYLRQIFVSMDITAPLYWWKEFDTYKVGTVANSCSTMHKIAAKEFELDDFSWEQLLNSGCDLIEYTWQNGSFKKMVQPLQLLTDFIIPSLNVCREKYLETKDKKYWWQLIQLLPSSYNQKRTVTMNYENVATMIRQRTGHKLDEWRNFVEILKDLPYVREIIDGSET
jgi:hypothetical protein